MKGWQVEIKEHDQGGYQVWVWVNDSDLGTKYRLEDKEKLKQFLDDLWVRLGKR